MAPTSRMSIFAATILGLGAMVNAAPLIARNETSHYTNTTSIAYAPASTPTYSRTYANPAIVTVTSVPQPPSQPQSPPSGSKNQPIATFLPDYTSQYNGRTGAVDFHTPRGLVSRSPTNNGADISTLVTFQLPASYAANTCQVVFDLTDYSSTVSGTAKAQLFTSLAPAYTDSESWPNGNLRNQMLGTVNVVKGGRATWEAGSGPGATVEGVFPCKEITGQIFGGEIVPQGDYDMISWAAGVDGVKILVF